MSPAVQYQLRMATDGIRRKPGLAVAIVVVLSLAGGMWTFGVCRYLRHHGPYPDLSPNLHQVEIGHGETPTIVRRQGTTHATAGWATHTRVSFPEYRTLAASGLPVRQTGTFRSRLLVSTEQGPEESRLARAVPGRFVNAPFFDMFQVPINAGRAFSVEEEAAGDAVVVIGHRLRQQLFPSGAARSIGRTLLIEGRPFRIVGSVAGDQPFRPTWDISAMDRDQDALYLPFDWFRRLRARPDTLVHQEPPSGTTFEDLLRTSAVFLAFWIELPDAASRQAYRRHLDETFHGPQGPRYVLRAYPEWRRAFTAQPTRVAFLSGLSGLLLLAGGFSTTRLLLTKEVTRRGELAVRRALGASRGSLFATQMLEAALLSSVAALLGVALALPLLAMFNRVVADADIPARLTAPSALLGAGAVLATGLLAAVLPAWRVSRSRPGLFISVPRG